MPATPTHLLHLDSSAGRDFSFSRTLGRELVLEWQRREPATVVTYRDLDAEPPPFVSGGWLQAAYTPPGQRDETATQTLQHSDALITELEAADVLVIGAPMYNFGIPASLKAWVDQVVRVGRTFGYDGPDMVGLLHGKRAIVLATSGGDARAYEAAGLDFRSSYLRALLGFVGITEVDVLTLTDTAPGSPDLAESRAGLDHLLDRHVHPSLVPA